MEKNSINYDYLIKEESIDGEVENSAKIHKEFGWEESGMKDFRSENGKIVFGINPNISWGRGVYTGFRDNIGWSQVELNSMEKDRIRNNDEENYDSNLNNSLSSNVTCEECSGFKKLDDDCKAFIIELCELKVEKISENFTSRELIKILIYFTKVNKFDRKIKKFAYFFADTRSELYKCLYKYRNLSLRGIKYWMLLSKEKSLEFLFKKYRPSSIHTIYKKLFSEMKLEEVYKLYSNNNEVDIIGVIKRINQKKKDKIKNLKTGHSETAADNNKYDSESNTEDQLISHKKLKRNKKNSKLENKTSHMHIVKEEENDLRIENRSRFKGPNYWIPNRQIISTNSIYHSPLADSTTRNKGVINQDNSKYQIDYKSLLENVSSSQALVDHPDKLSDLYDDINTVDIEENQSSLYMTVLNQGEKNRRFYFSENSTSNADASYLKKYNHVKFINDIRKEYKDLYDENFLIEAFMKVSNNESDLREYLSNPIHKSDVIWSLTEDEILLIFLNIRNKTTGEIIKLINKMMLFKGKERVQRRINFLMEHNMEGRSAFPSNEF